MFKYVFILLGLTIFGLIFGLINYLGFFKSVDLEIKTAGPVHFLFQQKIGPYHEISEKMDDIARKIKPLGLDCKSSIGRFLDDPNQVEQDRLRADIGCVIPADYEGDIPQDLTRDLLDKREYIIAKFNGSPSLGAVKVYPKAQKLMNSRGYRQDGSIVEIYTLTGDEGVDTEYFFPITK